MAAACPEQLLLAWWMILQAVQQQGCNEGRVWRYLHIFLLFMMIPFFCNPEKGNSTAPRSISMRPATFFPIFFVIVHLGQDMTSIEAVKSHPRILATTVSAAPALDHGSLSMILTAH